MARSNVGSGQHAPDRIIPERGQVPENDSQPSPNKHGGVFHEDVAGSNFAKYSRELAPEAASLALLDALSLARRRNVLARETAGDDQLGGVLAHPRERGGGVGFVGAEAPHVVPDGEPGEAGSEDALGVALDLDGDTGLDAVQQVGEEPPAGAGEEVDGIKGTIHGMVVSLVGCSWRGPHPAALSAAGSRRSR